MELEKIYEIISNLTDEEYETLSNADSDMESLESVYNTRKRRNAKKRLCYHLAKHGLTFEDWEAWIWS